MPSPECAHDFRNLRGALDHYLDMLRVLRLVVQNAWKVALASLPAGCQEPGDPRNGTPGLDPTTGVETIAAPTGAPNTTDPGANGTNGANIPGVGTPGGVATAGTPSGGGTAVTSPTTGATGGPSPDPGVTPAADACASGPTAPRAPLRRLTRYEYNNTVRDLLGVMSRPADALPGEEAGSGFGNDADALGVSRVLIDGYRIVAQQVALEVTAEPAAVQALTNCDPATADAACQDAFLTRYLTDAFRRPPAAEELAAYQAAFDAGVTLGGDFASGTRAVIERSLQSPQFLYRAEVGQAVDDSPGLARPTGYEMATRLSYLIWSSAPDRALLDAAARGDLDSDEGVLAEASRLLEDERAKDSLRYFHGQLFGIAGLDYIERDAEYYPTFVPGMGALFRQETEHFLDHVLWHGEGDLRTVFTAPYTFVNESLATFYGIAGVTGAEFREVALDPTRRGGLLTQASILTTTTPGSRTDPVVRGKWFYTKLLCGTVPDPPPDVPLLPEPTPGQSTRDRLAQHRADPACGTCHALMDPIGLAFEHYDGVGLWRDTDNGLAIDDSGEVPIGDVAGPFQGAMEFAQKMAESADVRACYVGRYLTYAYGRALDAGDDCSKARAEAAFELSEGNVQDLMLAVTSTDGFLLRPMVAPVE